MNQRLNGLLVQVRQAQARKRQLAESVSRSVVLPSEMLQRSQVEAEKGKQLAKKLNEANSSFEQLNALVNVSLQTMDKIAVLEKELAKSKATIASLESKNRTLEGQNSALRAESDERSTLITELVRKLEENEQKNEKKQVDTNQLRNKLKNTLSKLKLLKKDNQALGKNAKSDLSELKKEQLSFTNQIKSKLMESQKIQKQKAQVLAHQVYQTCSSVSQYTQIKRFPEQSLIKQLPTFSQQLIRFLSASRFLTQSQVVTQSSHKYWLLDELRENLACSDKVSSRLVYKFNQRQQNKTNFHKYIDGRSNLLILVKISNGIIVGAFTEFPFIKEHTEKPGNGFLFNVSRQVAYPMRNDPIHPVAVYDDYFLLFGNSEFRLRSLELKFFSNFGINTATFNSKGHKRIDFMGSEETQVDLIQFQIHEFMP